QIGAVPLEPALGANEGGIKPLHQPPEPQRMIELDEMAHLVRGKIVEDKRGGENEPPGKRQYARIRARAPTARLVAHVDAFDRDAELGRVAAACSLEITLRLALEKIADAAIDVRRFAGDAEQALPPLLAPDPRRAARAAAMDDAMRLPAQRHFEAVGERRRLRQPLEPRRNPAAVLLRELFGFLYAAARRHGEDHLARRRIDAQRVTSRLAMTAQPHRIDRLVENDLDDRGLAWPTVKERAHRHGSTLQQPRANSAILARGRSTAGDK